MPETRETGLQADLDLTRTPGMMLDTSNTSDLSLPSHLGGDDLEAELLPIRETKASIARKKKISEDNPKDPVHCHYPKNKNDHDHGHSHGGKGEGRSQIMQVCVLPSENMINMW